MPMTFGSATVTSYQRQKPPTPAANMMRVVTGRLRKLQEEIAVESVTNTEFEECSRRSFTVLHGQVRALKEAFSTLTDTVIAELDSVGTTVRKEISQLEERHSEFEKVIHRDIKQQLEERERIGGPTSRKVEQLEQDMENVLGIIPKMEDKMISSNSVFEERIERVAHGVADVMERVELKVGRLGSELRDELEQKHQKLQKSINRQLECVTRVLVESERAPPSGGLGVGSPQRDRNESVHTPPSNLREKFQDRLRENSEDRLRSATSASRRDTGDFGSIGRFRTASAVTEPSMRPTTPVSQRMRDVSPTHRLSVDFTGPGSDRLSASLRSPQSRRL